MSKVKSRHLNSKKSKELLKVALKLFIERGYNNVTVRDIVNEANSSMGNLYFHFSSKKKMLKFISERFLEILHKKTQKNLDLPFEPHVKFAIDLRMGLITTLEDSQMHGLYTLVREIPEIRKRSIENKRWRIRTFFAGKYPDDEIEPLALALQGISDAYFKVRNENCKLFTSESISNYIIKYNLSLLGCNDDQIKDALKQTDDYFSTKDYQISFDQVIESML